VIGSTSQRDLQQRQSVNEVVENVLWRYVVESLADRSRRIKLAFRSQDECCHLLACYRGVRTEVTVAASQRDSSGRELADVLGIDLQTSGATGITGDDPGDGDSGANNLQNFPVLSSAVSSAHRQR